jgi:hypothetical protein
MTPTYEQLPAFADDYRALPPAERERFLTAVHHVITDLQAGRPLRPGLRIKRVQGTAGVWEMTFAPDGRATFEYGPPVVQGQPHIVWRRVGSHAVLRRP